MVAGYDTTANTLTACCFLLAKYPELQEKLYDLIMSKVDQYVRSVYKISLFLFKWLCFGLQMQGDICHELIQDLPYVEQFMNEVLRMHPPVTT